MEVGELGPPNNDIKCGLRMTCSACICFFFLPPLLFPTLHHQPTKISLYITLPTKTNHSIPSPSTWFSTVSSLLPYQLQATHHPPPAPPSPPPPPPPPKTNPPIRPPPRQALGHRPRHHLQPRRLPRRPRPRLRRHLPQGPTSQLVRGILQIQGGRLRRRRVGNLARRLRHPVLRRRCPHQLHRHPQLQGRCLLGWFDLLR